MYCYHSHLPQGSSVHNFVVSEAAFLMLSLVTNHNIYLSHCQRRNSALYTEKLTIQVAQFPAVETVEQVILIAQFNKIRNFTQPRKQQSCQQARRQANNKFHADLIPLVSNIYTFCPTISHVTCHSLQYLISC